MSGNALPFVGNFYVHLIVFSNGLLRCSIQISIFKYKYIFEPNPDNNYLIINSVQDLFRATKQTAMCHFHRNINTDSKHILFIINKISHIQKHSILKTYKMLQKRI